MHAAKNGHPKCLKALIKAEANIDQADKDGRNPLYIAAQLGNTECLQALIEAGADINNLCHTNQSVIRKILDNLSMQQVLDQYANSLRLDDQAAFDNISKYLRSKK